MPPSFKITLYIPKLMKAEVLGFHYYMYCIWAEVLPINSILYKSFNKQSPLEWSIEFYDCSETWFAIFILPLANLRGILVKTSSSKYARIHPKSWSYCLSVNKNCNVLVGPLCLWASVLCIFLLYCSPSRGVYLHGAVRTQKFER